MAVFHLDVVTEDPPHQRRIVPSVADLLRDAIGKAQQAGHHVTHAELDAGAVKHLLTGDVG